MATQRYRSASLISIATVSRVLNRDPSLSVTEETKIDIVF